MEEYTLEICKSRWYQGVFINRLMLSSYYLRVEKIRAISFAERAPAAASSSLVASLFVISTASSQAEAPIFQVFCVHFHGLSKPLSSFKTGYMSIEDVAHSSLEAFSRSALY